MSDYANNMWARRIAAERAEGAKARAAAGLPSEQTVRDAMAASALDKVPRWADAVLQAVASPPVQPAAPTVAEPDAWAEEAERLALEYADVRSRQVVGDMNANPHRPERVKSALLAHLRSHPAAADAMRAARWRDALVWALGAHETDGFRERYAGDPPYWWRSELRERAGLEWDGERFIDDAAAPSPAPDITVAALAEASDRKAFGIMCALNVLGGNVTLNQSLDLALIGAALSNAGCNIEKRAPDTAVGQEPPDLCAPTLDHWTVEACAQECERKSSGYWSQLFAGAIRDLLNSTHPAPSTDALKLIGWGRETAGGFQVCYMQVEPPTDLPWPGMPDIPWIPLYTRAKEVQP
jgi:hypothetical protein